MSVQQCTKDGHPGWQNGSGGVCHTGRLGKARAMADTPVATKPRDTPIKNAKATLKGKKAAPKKAAAKKK